MKRLILSLTLLFTTIFYFNLSAQCTLDPPGSCENPVAICDADLAGGLSIDMSQGAPDPTGQFSLCGSGTVQNVTFFAFTASSTEITFELMATNCSNPSGMGAGIQWGLAQDGTGCANGTELVCNSSNNQGLITITSDQFVIGEDYVIYVDGFGGSVCDLVIEVTEGTIGLDVGEIDEPDPEFDGFLFDPPLVGNELCLGGQIGFSVTPPAGVNADLQLSIDPPTSDYPLGIIELPPGTYNTLIDFNSVGTYEICGFAFNCCDSSEVQCQTFEVVPIPEEILPDEVVCQNDLFNGYIPDGWEGPAIFSAGDYSVDIESANYLCDLQQSISITEQPLQPAEFVSMMVCDPNNTFITQICDMPIGGDQNNTQVICPGADKNGCDSVIFLTLDFVNVPAVLFDPVCVDGMLEFQLGAGLPNPTNLYEINFTMLLDGEEIWSENSDDWDLFNEFIVVPIEQGLYTVEISIERFGTECVFVSNSINASGNGLIPDEPEIDTWDLNPCVLDSITYALNANNDPENTYNWDVSPSTGLVIEDNNTELGVNWENAVPGTTYTICVEADNGCGKSPPLCEDVEVIAQPIASFVLPDSICLNSDAVLEYDGTPLQSGDYVWNFDGGTIDLPDDNNPGPFNVSYSTTGKKVVSVLVNQGACTSEIYVDSIFVVAELPEPIISCNSETDFIEFAWDVVADDYIVNVNSAPPGAIFDQTDGMFTVTGLNPNDMVEIELIAVDNGVCNNVFTIESCIAQNCPPVDISIDSIPPICLIAGASVIDLVAMISPFDGNATIEWSGNGIVDAAQGTFDPSVAEAGSHLIVLDYVTDCPYNQSLTIEVQEQPVATYSVTDTICITESAEVIYTGTFSTGVFDWDFDEGNATGNGSAPFEVSWDTPGVKTLSLNVDNSGCVSEDVTALVVVQDTLDPLVIDCDPQTNDITFSWNDIDNASGYIVTVNGVEIGVQNGTEYFVDGLEPGNIVDISVVAISNNKCSNVSDFVSCTALNCPPVVIDLTADNTSVCLDGSGNTVQINSDILGGEPEAEITWIGTAVDQNGVFDPTVSGTGLFEIIFQYENFGCTETDTIDITVLPTPVASFDANQTVCITDSLDLTFTGSFDTDANFNWVNPNGIVVGSGDDYKTGFSNAGTYTLELTIEEDGCTSPAFTLDVEVQEELTMPPQGFGCVANTESITFSWPEIDCASSYIIYVNGVEQETINSTSYEVQDLDAEQVVLFDVLAVSECACGDQLFSTSCETEACPELNQNIEMVDPICLTDETQSFQMEYTVNGTPNISDVVWDGMGVSENGVFDPAVSGPGSHFVSVSFNVGNCMFFTNTLVQINETPGAEISTQDPSCAATNDGTIAVMPTGGSGDYTVLINNNELIGGVVDTLEGNTYTISITDGNECEYVETFVLTQPSDQEVTIAGNISVISGDTNSYSLNSNIPMTDVNSITWVTSDGATICSGADCEDVQFAPIDDVTLCAIVDYGNGCLSENCIDIRAEKIKLVYIPNTFSPNEDGVNDKWVIFPNEEIISMPLLQIYNRYGERMFEETDLALDGSAPSWDGQFKGRRLNPGVYVYRLNVVYVDGSAEVLEGTITILN